MRLTFFEREIEIRKEKGSGRGKASFRFRIGNVDRVGWPRGRFPKSRHTAVESVSSIALVSIDSFLFIEARREKERERKDIPPPRKSIAGSARTASRRRACVLLCAHLPLLSPTEFFSFPSRNSAEQEEIYTGPRIFPSLSLPFIPTMRWIIKLFLSYQLSYSNLFEFIYLIFYLIIKMIYLFMC